MRKRIEYITKSRDPFEAREEVWRERLRILNAEIVRLKMKCNEDFTMDEMLDGFGEQPNTIYVGGKRGQVGN